MRMTRNSVIKMTNQMCLNDALITIDWNVPLKIEQPGLASSMPIGIFSIIEIHRNGANYWFHFNRSLCLHYPHLTEIKSEMLHESSICALKMECLLDLLYTAHLWCLFDRLLLTAKQ